MRETPTRRPGPLNVYVSASSRGVGFEIARRMAVSGDNVTISSRSASHLDAARTEILNAAPQSRVFTVTADVSRAEDQVRVLAQLEAEHLVPDVFVCGAGHPKTLH